MAYAKQSDNKHYSRLCGEEYLYLKGTWNEKYHYIIYSSPKGQSRSRFDGDLNQYSPERDLEGKKYRQNTKDGTYNKGSTLAPAKSIYQLLPTKARSCLYPIVLIVDSSVDVSLKVPKDRVRSHTYVPRIIRKRKWYSMYDDELGHQVYIFS